MKRTGRIITHKRKFKFNSISNKVTFSSTEPIVQYLIIHKDKCRTPQFKEGFDLIYSETRSLQRLKTKKRDNLSTLSLFVPLTLPPSNSFYENVEERYALKETFVQQGILSGEGHGLALARPQVMLGNKICWCSKITSKEWFRCF